jgi:hypothetical protein
VLALSPTETQTLSARAGSLRANVRVEKSFIKLYYSIHKLAILMDKALRIVIPNEVRNFVLSGKDCLVASLLAMTFIKESLNLGHNNVGCVTIQFMAEVLHQHMFYHSMSEIHSRADRND